MHPGQTQHGAIALRFARALTSGDFALAHSLLAPTLSSKTSASDLRAFYENMISYGQGPPTLIEVMNTLEDWPAKQPKDIGWAYVAISGPGYGEAVTVVVTERSLIREIEWGRP